MASAANKNRMTHLSVRILGTGAFVPALRVTAEDLDARLGLPPGTTLARNAVRSRHFASLDETASLMSACAISRALGAAGLAAADLDAILFSGVMPEQPMPSTAVLIHARLGCRSACSCFDINASCVGFLKGVEIAACAIATGMWRRVAVVAAEIASKGIDWDDLDTCTLFGDGAAAAILGPTRSGESSAILAARHATVSEGAGLCVMRAGGSRFNIRTPPPDDKHYLFSMQGKAVLRLVHEHLPGFYADLLAATGEPVSLIVPHQASAIGLAYFRKVLARDIPVAEILSDFGNQVSASLPTALDVAIRRGSIHRGDTIMLLGTAAGLSMSGIVLRY